MEKNLSGSLGGVIDEMLSGSVAGNIKFETSGGSSVTITPTLESGTKIADFTIDDESGVLYAPTPEPPIEYEAGDNITIEDGVISATDTTYTAGTGISIDNGVISADGGSKTQLYTGTERVNEITLSDSISNYDFILFSGYATAGTGFFNTSLFQPSDISINNHVGVSDDVAFIWYKFTDNTTLVLDGANGSYYIKSIVGIKL